MANFGKYSAQREDGAAVRTFTFYDLDGTPKLDCRPATKANPKYNSARFKAFNKRTRGGRKTLKVTPQSQEQARREDAALLSKYCVVGWPKSPPIDDDTEQPVEFSVENCRQFLLAIPDEMFDDMRAWITDGQNFVGEEDDFDDLDDLDEAGEDEPDTDDDEGNGGQSLQTTSHSSSSSTETVSR